MQRSERSAGPDHPVGRLLVESGKAAIYELILTPERSRWLWEQMQRYPTLFSDQTRDDPDNLWAVLASPQAMWGELWESGKLVGVLYLSEIQANIDAKVHVIFFDRNLTARTEICRAAMRWAFATFHFHRLTITVPEIYFSTTRLAKRLGFVREGLRRDAYLIGGKRVNELLFGLLASEMQDG